MNDNNEYLRREDVLRITALGTNYHDYHTIVKALPITKLGDTEAVALLTKVCEQIKNTSQSNKDIGKPLYYLGEIPGLKEWWAKHKPKTEREIKLEKIATVLSLDGKTPTDELRVVARRVLDAIS